MDMAYIIITLLSTFLVQNKCKKKKKRKKKRKRSALPERRKHCWPHTVLITFRGSLELFRRVIGLYEILREH